MSAGERQAAAWVDEQVETIRSLNRAANLAGWEAATTGSVEAVDRSAGARAALRRLFSDRAAAARVRELLRSAEVTDPLLRRQLTLLDLAFTGNQLPERTIDELTRREAALEQTFYTFRAPFEGEGVSNNVLLDVLREETDSERRRAAWEASKQVGREVAGPLRDLVRQRNEGARSLGFANFYSMELALQEIDEEALFTLLDRFRADSEEEYRALRVEMDRALADRFGIAPEEVRPWHWSDFFSQEAPAIGKVELDAYVAGRDLVAVARDYFAEIGLPVEDVLERSDLLERPGKDQHAFCTDIDREGDVRVLCNLRDNERWLSTLLHELGHAVYDKFIPPSLPYLVRTTAHTMVTESVAMYMGRLTREPEWLRHALGVETSAAEVEDIRRQQRMSMLVSARWIMVMAYFERELYRDPGRTDLNGLWWDLVESIQHVRRPEGRDEPDWAAKIHLSLAPVYYHNYLLGEMMASQVGARVRAALPAGASPVGRPEVGDFLRDRIFAYGATLSWDELMLEATGERLTPRFFVEDFVTPAAR